MTLFSVFVDVYHKDQLLTRKEAEEVAAVVLWEAIWESKCVEVAVTKDGDTAARIADILDKYGFNDVSQRIKGTCVYCCLCTNAVQDAFEKTQLYLNVSCMLHSCISCILCMCGYIVHYSRALVMVIMCFK